MNKHTKGPWELDIDGMYFEIDAPNGTGVCSCDWFGTPLSEQDELIANAKLIAAAPELLEALQALLAPLGPNGYVLPAGAGATAMARRAIAKAVQS